MWVLTFCGYVAQPRHKRKGSWLIYIDLMLNKSALATKQPD